ncbi:MAG: phenylacetate--CoA ligase family protein [Gemmatimonadales bacterium]
MFILRSLQAAKFDALVKVVIQTNPFYTQKLNAAGFTRGQPPKLIDIDDIPYTTKQEFATDQETNPPFGTNLSFPPEHYSRMHQTSGTTGRPLYWLDTIDSWDWWLGCWMEIYEAACVTADDRVFVAFSFGPFIGFWTAFEAGERLGALMLSGGGLSSKQRLETMRELQATVLICTPTYALRLAEVARQEGIALTDIPIRVSIHAGEPGASIPNVRTRIETAWGAPCVDHAGATEIGAWGYSCGVDNHMHINEAEFVAEVIDPHTLEPGTISDGAQRGELVLTNLGRVGSPVIRYRTGDLVELLRTPCECGRSTAHLRGGVLGRIDDMMVVRGINVFPTALENIVREFDEIDEFEVAVRQTAQMADLQIRIEVTAENPGLVRDELGRRVHDKLNLKPSVELVEQQTLPRYELKAHRFKTEKQE